MTSPALALCLAFLLLSKIVQTTDPTMSSTVHRERSFISADVGATLTLKCFCSRDLPLKIYWYKQPLGEKPRLIYTFETFGKRFFHEEFQNNRRFSIDSEIDKIHLKIADLQISDSAIYMCFTYHFKTVTFSESVTVSVKGPGSNIKVLVHQPSSGSFQPGDSVTLSCTVHTGSCDEEHTVYWFKDSEEHREPLGLLYTHGNRTDRCETKSNSCVYNLSMENLDRSQSGIYYCAVASCGHILFGNGTRLEIPEIASVWIFVYFLTGALTLTTISSVLLGFFLYKTTKRNNSQSPETGRGLSAPVASNSEDHQDPENLHYAALNLDRACRARRQRKSVYSECVYSRIRM